MIQSQLQKVKNYVLSRIESGKWRLHTKIPSEFELVKRLSISRSTVNRALKELSVKGFLPRVQGLGTFVSDKKFKYALLEIKSIADEISDRGGVYGCKVITLEEQKADQHISIQLEIKQGTQIFFSKIVHTMSSSTLQLAERYINPAFAPNYLDQDFNTVSPSDYLFSQGELTQVEQTIEASMPDLSTKKILHLKCNEPCLIIHRKTWSKGIVVNYARLIHPASQFTPSSLFSPKNNTSRLIA